MSKLSAGTAEDQTPKESSNRIFRFENHDEALQVWRDSGSMGRILVHVDAHHDMWWVPQGALVSIANFIAPALRDGILREIYWVVPDGSWESDENRRQIIHHLQMIQRDFPGGAEPLEVTRDRISTTLLGRPLHICSVNGLPEFHESVLLDLDVDYLIFSRVSYGPGDPHPALPWRWPEELVSLLHERGLQWDIATIAYSVRGGFTPLRWKYLGDELAARLGGMEKAVRGMELIREGAQAAARGEFAVAQSNYLEAATQMPNLAAPLWHLAFLYLDVGRVSEGQEMYQRAIGLDASYRTAFSSAGIWEYWGRRTQAAEAEYRRTLALDPEDAHAHLGLGWIAMENSNWSEAETELRKAIEIQTDLLDAHRALGRVLRKFGRRPEAIAAYEQSLKLALLGHEPLGNSHSISTEPQSWNDNSHFVVYSRIGQLYYAEGDLARACQYLRMAAAGKLDSAGIRYMLASIAFKQRNWKTALVEAGHTLKQSLAWLGRRTQYLPHDLQGFFARRREFRVALIQQGETAMSGVNNSYLGKWRRFRKRPAEDRALILCAMVFMPLTEIGLRLFGFHTWKELIERFSLTARPHRELTGALQQEKARSVVRAVRSVELHGPATPNCLERSMVLWWLLRREGIQGELHVGARKEGTRFEAHAWVELGGQVLNDSAEVHNHYARFDAPIAAAEMDARAASNSMDSR